MSQDSVYLIQMVVQGFTADEMKDFQIAVSKRGTDLEAVV